MASYNSNYGGGYRSTNQGFGYASLDQHALKNLRKISPTVQNHLKRVYLSLSAALVAAAVGVYLHLLWNIGGLLTGLAFVGSIFWLKSIPAYSYNENKRVMLLMAAALLNGASLGPLVDIVIKIDPSVLATAFIGTGLAFVCFSGAAILARRREFIFLGGLLGSGISILLWLKFASALFGGFSSIHKFEIYFGLLLFIGYIIFDTQMIIERADHGDHDYVKHSLELFTDFAAVFVRLLIMMTRNAASKSEKEKRKRRD